MRHIPLSAAIAAMTADPNGAAELGVLAHATATVHGWQADDRVGYIQRNGTAKWSPIKDHFTTRFGNKCWYTEAELVGAHLTIDHFRPKSVYWWLAFTVENYRVACPFANSPESDGGKGERFPLLHPNVPATGPHETDQGRPVILDPCEPEDARLIAFQPDGRPVIHPDHAHHPVAQQRVRESKILLNLDHPDFNSKRAELYRDIADDIADHAALSGNMDRQKAKARKMERRLAPTSAFSSAARFYLLAYRYLPWVQEILDRNQDHN